MNGNLFFFGIKTILNFNEGGKLKKKNSVQNSILDLIQPKIVVYQIYILV